MACHGRDEVRIGRGSLRLIGYVSIRAYHYYPWNETSSETTNRSKKIASLTTSVCIGYPSIVTRRVDDAINTSHRDDVQLGDATSKPFSVYDFGCHTILCFSSSHVRRAK